MKLPVSKTRVLVFWLCLSTLQVQRACGVCSCTKSRLGSLVGIATRPGPSKITTRPSSSGDFMRLHSSGEGCLERSRDRRPNIHLSGRAKTKNIESWIWVESYAGVIGDRFRGRQISFSISATRLEAREFVGGFDRRLYRAQPGRQCDR